MPARVFRRATGCGIPRCRDPNHQEFPIPRTRPRSRRLHVSTPPPSPDMARTLLRLDRRPPGVLWCTGLEAVLELSWNLLHVPHASSAGRLSPLGLLSPVVCCIESQPGVLILHFPEHRLYPTAPSSPETRYLCDSIQLENVVWPANKHNAGSRGRKRLHVHFRVLAEG